MSERSDGTQGQRFSAGTFAPDPRPARPARMLAAQGRLELVLLLRNGEQLLLTMLIPITLLLGLSLLPIVDLPTPRVNSVVPGVMALAVMSTAFTGQAIAVGFDRRYGALKRLGATPLPRSCWRWRTSSGSPCSDLAALWCRWTDCRLGWPPSPGCSRRGR